MADSTIKEETDNESWSDGTTATDSEMIEEIITPRWDMTILSDKIKFCVSEKALSFALQDPLLEAEHQVLQVSEDPDALRIVLNIIHHKSEAIPPDLEPEMVLRAARCARSLGCCSSLHWMDDLWRLLLSAYAMNLSDRFFDFSRELICRRPSSFASWEFSRAHIEWLPADILDRLDSQKETLMRKIQSALWSFVNTLAPCKCWSASEYIAAYVRALRESEILPGTDELTNSNFLQIRRKVAALPEMYCNFSDFCECSPTHAGEYYQPKHLVGLLDKCIEGVEVGVSLDIASGSIETTQTL
ncbi:uncharacterized protein DSM5745_11157 [Aspergillus mulundensis]|uniref:BTB domain-containing protein n=1 Tax=Aspergillus mulundensis TaxID=1810919 RepID=A0A3D8QB08_9EURO|nr:hypothetical protein DSM5745_11157 [Aspergillus mulundensis]RDW58951.1 hypothetical protein DSM5745_11157 [Aspergillus mulundensis]